jgi:DNA recombination protein RmuC
MNTLLASSLTACVAIVVALLVYFVTRSSYNARAAAAEATARQLTEQLGERGTEMNTLRGQLATEQNLRARAEATLEEGRKLIVEQKNTLNEAERKLTVVFEGLASKALANNTTTFLQLADATLKSGAVKDLQSLVKPLEETLETYQANLRAIEDARLKAYGEITTTLGQVSQTQETLKSETQNLVSSLRRPNVRGRWGELTLRRVAELTGMSEHCDFNLQTQVETEDGNSLRPDMTINLPKGVIVPVDSKVPLDQYLDAMAATSDETRKEHFKRHANALRERMKTLASKDYAGQFPITPDVTVLFLPSDAFLSAALEFDNSLLDDAMQKKIVIATPVSLFCLLKAVAYGWQQEAIAQNAQAISDLGKELYGRIAVLWGHLDKLRNGLVSAVDGFDATIGSIESRVLPSVRRFKELGATTEDKIEVLEKIGREPRALRLTSIEIKAAEE